MKSFKLRIGITALVLAVALVAIGAFNGPASASPLPPTFVITSPPADDASTSVKAIGMFVSANQATLAFQAAGRVKQINVKEGDAVHAGDLLVSLDTTMLDLQVAQAQAALDTTQARLDQLKTPTVNDIQMAKADLDMAQAAVSQAQAAYDRTGGASNPFIGMLPQSLALQQASDMFLKAQAAFNARTNPSDAQLKQSQALVDQAQAALNRLTNPSPNDVKTAQAAVAQAQATLDLAKQNIANSKIVAPFDGTVVWFGPHLGESAAPNAPVVTVSDLSHMQVQIGVDENTLAQLKLGQTATITADSMPGKTFTGHISKIGLLATTTAGIISLPVTIDVDATNSVIAPGLSAIVEIKTGN